jgi:hypothetical protein
LLHRASEEEEEGIDMDEEAMKFGEIMNKKVILRMAKEAGLVVRDSDTGTITAYMKFARLVADAEREYCAAICDDQMEIREINTAMAVAAGNCADLIRARGE